MNPAARQNKSGANFSRGYLLLSTLIQVVGLSCGLNEQQMLMEYDLLDVVCKLAGCHTMTKRLKEPSSRHDMEPEPDNAGQDGFITHEATQRA